MKIKEIQFKNMISNDGLVKLSFMNKYKEQDAERFFSASLTPKPRSSTSKEGILNTISLMGKNASYKSSILSSIKLILMFITNFKNNANNLAKSKIHPGMILDWYEQKKKTNNLFRDSGIKWSEIIDEFYEESTLENMSDINKSESYIKEFFEDNAFNKSSPLDFMVIFYDEKTKEDITVDAHITIEDDELIHRVKINNKISDLYTDGDLLFENFKHSFVSYEYYKIEKTKKDTLSLNRDFKITNLEKSIKYLFVEKFHRDIGAFNDFMKILDPSFQNIMLRENTKSGDVVIQGMSRKYGDFIDRYTSIENLSSGTKVFIVYLCHILQNDFIIIDELEQSLHLKLVELLLDIARNNNKQIIFSTHSPLVIEKFVKPYELHILETNSNEELYITKGTKFFRGNDSFINKYVNGLVSGINDYDLGTLKMEFYE